MNLTNETNAHHGQSEFNAMIDRREFLSAAGATGLAVFLAANPITQAMAMETDSRNRMGFKPIPASTADKVVVPKGYRAEVLISWGDPIFPDAPAFRQEADAKAQERQFGDNNDGMTLFPMSNDRAVIAVNHEYTNYEYLFPHRGQATSADEVRKAQAAHGVTIVELEKEGGRWRIDRNGKLNRRITANTPMEIAGPASGHDRMKTALDKAGHRVLGTVNNCANGQTPWGTYLTCEENFNYYFVSGDNAELADTYQRYGISRKDKKGYQWYRFDERFDVARHPNEAHRFGWVVEIDPMDPASIPKKRTALGRIKHENAALAINDSGHVVVYMGDDERGEHLYKFVSRNRYDPNNMAANRDLLDEGTLYVARLDGKKGEQKGIGRWIELTWGKHGLTPENGFADQAEVLIFARQAATRVDATTMDRPEWVAVHPGNGHVFCTMTNNKYRGVKENQPVDAVNPRKKNIYGHIVRWYPDRGDHTAEVFSWDLYMVAGNPVVHDGPYAGSDNITPENMFNSPDGLGFDGDGRLWILTDGKYSNQGDFAGMGNNQMLCGDPDSGEIRRFLTGPVGCEITGLTFSPDYKTMFVGIQHPGEKLTPSHFPEGGDAIPRSSVMMITREDGGVIGA
uniref:Transcriptional initiation protein Tat n=1 Tax=Candidatus Kentrum sp. FW TaxID=2126338 RepID=A0A450T422_9GAMM|nr:MAG: hypothetical protein BECKFW1821B_GA0114236_101140 [Candidatus Kentron sp. FW]VFJ61340.1 MAG: hypothetical protein BECKFW1821A_GA0114235_111215 [Candidatus Kentron sp. FW]